MPSIEELETRIIKIEKGHQRLSDSITCLKESIEKYGGLLEEIHGFVQALSGFVRVLAWVGHGMRIIGKYIVVPVMGVAAGVYMLTHQGETPQWMKDLLKFL